MAIDWTLYNNFSEDEFKCSTTGRCEMKADFLECLQVLRDVYGKPMRITSGYRCPLEHPNEMHKARAGSHAYGLAVDIAVAYKDAYDLLACAIELNYFTGIGIAQKGNPATRFIHLDTATVEVLGGSVRPTIWSY